MAVKTGIELIKGMRYELHMMGIPVEGHAHVRVDNMSVVNNTRSTKLINVKEEEQRNHLPFRQRECRKRNM